MFPVRSGDFTDCASPCSLQLSEITVEPRGWLENPSLRKGLPGIHKAWAQDVSHLTHTPSAAQEHRGTAPPTQCRRSAPRCAAEAAPADQTRERAGLVGSPRRQALRQRPSQSTLCLPPREDDASRSSPCSS